MIESDFDADFTKRMLQKVEYPVLAEAARVTNIENIEFPNELPSDWESNETFLTAVSFLQKSKCFDNIYV